jgi:tetratricopeptide (TPR) repeat protein
MENCQYPAATFWYEAALRCPRRDERGGFIQPDRYGIYPALQLCLCYHYLGDRAKAIEWNERAALLQPEHPAVAWNRRYFRQ